MSSDRGSPDQLAARLRNADQHIDASLELLDRLWLDDDVGRPDSQWEFVIQVIDSAWGPELSKLLVKLMQSVQLAINREIVHKSSKGFLEASLRTIVLPALRKLQVGWKDTGCSASVIKAKWKKYLGHQPLREIIGDLLLASNTKLRKGL